MEARDASIFPVTARKAEDPAEMNEVRGEDTRIVAHRNGGNCDVDVIDHLSASLQPRLDGADPSPIPTAPFA